MPAGRESLCGCARCGAWGRAHWRPQEEGLVVIDVIQGHLHGLHGLIRHWLAQVAGHQDELEVEGHSQRRSHRAPEGHSRGQTTLLKTF